MPTFTTRLRRRTVARSRGLVSGAADPVEHVPLQPVAGRYARVIEVVGRVAAHAEPVHHAPRAVVAGGGEGDDLVEAESSEAVVQGGARGLRRVAAAPVRAGDPPADL